MQIMFVCKNIRQKFVANTCEIAIISFYSFNKRCHTLKFVFGAQQLKLCNNKLSHVRQELCICLIMKPLIIK